LAIAVVPTPTCNILYWHVQHAVNTITTANNNSCMCCVCVCVCASVCVCVGDSNTFAFKRISRELQKHEKSVWLLHSTLSVWVCVRVCVRVGCVLVALHQNALLLAIAASHNNNYNNSSNSNHMTAATLFMLFCAAAVIVWVCVHISVCIFVRWCMNFFTHNLRCSAVSSIKLQQQQQQQQELWMLVVAYVVVAGFCSDI